MLGQLLLQGGRERKKVEHMNQTLRFFDSHCHVGIIRHGSMTVDIMRSRWAAAGVQKVVIVGVDAATSEGAKATAEKLGHDTAWWSAGIHPNSALRCGTEFGTIRRLVESHRFCVAVGETGLDLYRNRCELELQRASFIKHVELALEVDRPIIIHCRDAYEETLNTLGSFRGIRGVMHCFSGTAQQAAAFERIGLHLSFAGPLTYPRNISLREACKFTSMDKIVVETDSPFLPPQSRRGATNEPACVAEVCAVVAQCKGLSKEEVSAQVFRNSMRLFEPKP